MILKDIYLTRWLVYAALVDWLVARTLTRLGIFMPKSPALISMYQSLTLFGQAAASFAGLLVLATLLVWVLREADRGKHLAGVAIIGTLAFSSILFLFLQPTNWMAVSYHLLLISALAYTCWRGLRSVKGPATKLAICISTLALQAGAAGHLVQQLGFHGSGLILFKIGELFILFSSLLFWYAFGRPASGRVWFAAALPALAFSIFRILDPATSGILAIWSTGMTLYLPWPFYSLGIWLLLTTVLVCRKKGDPRVYGILLLAAGGFAAQMTSHAFFGLAGLGLLISGPRSEGIKALQGTVAKGVEEDQRVFDILSTKAQHANKL